MFLNKAKIFYFEHPGGLAMLRRSLATPASKLLQIHTPHQQ
jgi:hypothetical protein